MIEIGGPIRWAMNRQRRGRRRTAAAVAACEQALDHREQRCAIIRATPDRLDIDDRAPAFALVADAVGAGVGNHISLGGERGVERQSLLAVENARHVEPEEIGGAHVGTPVTNAQIVYSLRL